MSSSLNNIKNVGTKNNTDDSMSGCACNNLHSNDCLNDINCLRLESVSMEVVVAQLKFKIRISVNGGSSGDSVETS